MNRYMILKDTVNVININNHYIKLVTVLYSPYAIANIISGIKLIRTGIKTVSELIDNEVTLKLIKNSKTITTFTANNMDQIIINSKYYNINENKKQINAISNNLDENSKLIWHRLLGHFYHKDLDKYLKLHKITEPLCTNCHVTKIRKKPHNQ